MGWPENSRVEITVSGLFIDRQDKLWIGTRGNGIWRYEKNQFAKLQPDETNRGDIWFSGDEAADGHSASSPMTRYDGRTYHTLPPVGDINSSSVWFVLKDPSGNMWVGTRNTGLYRSSQAEFPQTGLVFTRMSE